jgi:hypothetical protein
MDYKTKKTTEWADIYWIAVDQYYKRLVQKAELKRTEK